MKSQVSLSLPSKKEYTLLVPLTYKQKALCKLVLGALDASAVRALFGQGGGVDDGEGGGGGVKVTDYRLTYIYLYHILYYAIYYYAFICEACICVICIEC